MDANQLQAYLAAAKSAEDMVNDMPVTIASNKSTATKIVLVALADAVVELVAELRQRDAEYARGREDAVKAIRTKAAEYDATHSQTRFDLCFHYGDIADRLDSLAEAIERGEHVEGSDGR